MYSPILILHICTAFIAVFVGSAAMLVRKGSRPHRRWGDVFVVSMMCMSASGAYMAVLKSQRLNVLAGVFTFYLVASACLTVIRKENQIGRTEFALMLVAAAAGVSGWILALTTPAFAVGYGIFGSIALLSAAGDIRMLVRRGLAGSQRIVRHLWRMGFALFVATVSLFIGTSGDPVFRRTGLRARLFPPSVRATHLPAVPVFIVVLLTLFWLFRVLFTNGDQGSPAVARHEVT